MLAREDEGGKDGDGGQEELGEGGRNMPLLSFHLSLNSIATMSVFLSVVCV